MESRAGTSCLFDPADVYPVTAKHIEDFRRDGVVVLEGVLTPAEVEEAKAGLAATMLKHGVDLTDLERTAGELRKLSSTGGAGGVIDLFYPAWKMQIATHPRFFTAISQLWAATYATDDHLYRHPHGSFDPWKGYCYLDRIGLRVPTPISELHRRGKRPLQRSLTPHLDCCPSALHSSGKDYPRWRPIQSFVALTDNPSRDRGGFECMKGFHREFADWALRRPPSVTPAGPIPPPCKGDFTPIRPKEDQDVIERFESVLYRAGDVVSFDWRTPHANASHHHGVEPRLVVYGSFLPDVKVNRVYTRRQWELYQQGYQPNDQWIDADAVADREGEDFYSFTPLGSRLVGHVPWDASDCGGHCRQHHRPDK